MKSRATGRDPTDAEYQALASFRYALRRYLAAVGRNARSAGLTAQQHQALLSIRAGYPGREVISVTELADHLLIKNHSALELAERLRDLGLIQCDRCDEDRRKVMLSITPKGETTLRKLAAGSLRELALISGQMRSLVAGLSQLDP
ncbi:winged helix DNA-binding protein [Steroidobacter sp. S1-65]|uniref:Winged helix DNA-binding protein n=1 Tax=Steroidobacter gossypii TaxID=2805490 RepID=A0ABS1WV83_9GAMM|nr:MarR family transcriptional regulator [Steroidobacter gossypii]MBM0104885.1 winged helix DNA-binding protein [Steroidobacter gossypii]